MAMTSGLANFGRERTLAQVGCMIYFAGGAPRPLSCAEVMRIERKAMLKLRKQICPPPSTKSR